MLFTLCIGGSNLRAQVRSLEYYLVEGIRNSPVLTDYSHQIRSNELDSTRLHAGWLPQLSLNTGATMAPIIRGYGYDEVITNQGSYNVLLSLTQSILGAGNREHQYETLRFQRSSLENNRTIVEMGLRKSITAQYLTTYGDRLQLQYLDESIALFRDEERVLHRLTESGVYRQVDYQTFLLTVQQCSMQRLQMFAQFQNDLSGLHLLCGIHDTSTTAELLDPALELATGVVADRSPLSHQFLLDSLLLQAQDGQIDYNYQPRINLLADAGFLSTLAWHAEQNFGASVGLNLSLPLFDGGQRGLQHEQVALQEATRAGYRALFQTQSEMRHRQLKTQLLLAEQLVAESQTQEQSSAVLVEAYRSLLATGDARIADYVSTVSSYISARNLSAQNRIHRMQIINQINFLYLVQP